MRLPQHGEGLPRKRMMGPDNRDAFREVPVMGSV